MEKKKSKWSIRKGCMYCRGPLKTMGEKVLRTCKGCAKGARDGFEKMGTGKFKEGFGDVTDTMFGKGAVEKKKATEDLMKAGLSKGEAKIRKRLKKKGLTEEEIEEGLKQFKGNIK